MDISYYKNVLNVCLIRNNLQTYNLFRSKTLFILISDKSMFVHAQKTLTLSMLVLGRGRFSQLLGDLSS